MRKITEVLRLKFEARLSHERIAAATGLSKGAVSNYAQRARAPPPMRPSLHGNDATDFTKAGRLARHQGELPCERRRIRSPRAHRVRESELQFLLARAHSLRCGARSRFRHG